MHRRHDDLYNTGKYLFHLGLANFCPVKYFGYTEFICPYSKKLNTAKFNPIQSEAFQQSYEILVMYSMWYIFCYTLYLLYISFRTIVFMSKKTYSSRLEKRNNNYNHWRIGIKCIISHVISTIWTCHYHID